MDVSECECVCVAYNNRDFTCLFHRLRLPVYRMFCSVLSFLFTIFDTFEISLRLAVNFNVVQSTEYN